MPEDMLRRLFLVLWLLAAGMLLYGLAAEDLGEPLDLFWWGLPLALVAAAHYVVRPFPLPVLPKPHRALWVVAVGLAAVVVFSVAVDPPYRTSHNYDACGVERPNLSLWSDGAYDDCAVETRHLNSDALAGALLLALAPILAAAAFAVASAWTRRAR